MRVGAGTETGWDWPQVSGAGGSGALASLSSRTSCLTSEKSLRAMTIGASEQLRLKRLSPACPHFADEEQGLARGRART